MKKFMAAALTLIAASFFLFTPPLAAAEERTQTTALAEALPKISPACEKLWKIRKNDWRCGALVNVQIRTVGELVDGAKDFHGDPVFESLEHFRRLNGFGPEIGRNTNIYDGVVVAFW